MPSGWPTASYLNIDNITWECDYPHSDSTWPQAPEIAMKYLEGVPDDEVNKITHLNAMRHFRYDPFSVRPREQCTVAALRAESPDVDLSVMRRSREGTTASEERRCLAPISVASSASRTTEAGTADRLTSPMPIHYKVGDDHVARITVDRPEAKNAMDMEHFFQLRSAWDRFGEDEDAWVAIITGVGDSFLVGADLKTYIPQITEHQRKIAAGEVADLGGYQLDDGVKAVLRGVKLYKPIIAAVNGTCVAGGMEMLGGCDIRVAADTATFGVLEPKRGLFAGGGTTVRLPRQIPYPAAMEFLLCADRISAAKAFEMGLLNEVRAPDQLMERAIDYAARIMANGPLAVRKTKESVLRGLATDMREAYRIESEMAGEVFSSEDAKEGPKAFAEKRPPVWKGR